MRERPVIDFDSRDWLVLCCFGVTAGLKLLTMQATATLFLKSAGRKEAADYL